MSLEKLPDHPGGVDVLGGYFRWHVRVGPAVPTTFDGVQRHQGILPAAMPFTAVAPRLPFDFATREGDGRRRVATVALRPGFRETMDREFTK